MPPQSTTDIRREIAGERRELADLLDSLSADQWDAPTLCTGWRVREVVAHLTTPYRYGVPRLLLDLARARGDVNRMADRCARRDAAVLSPGELTATLRDNAEHPWRPPGAGYAGALSHDVIHGMDVAVPLGVDRRVPLDRLRLILDATTSRQVAYFGVDLAGVQLRADDLDWTFGSGAPLTGNAQDLLLVLCGRTLPPGRLHGEPSHRFTLSS